MTDRDYLRKLVTDGLAYLDRMDDAQCAAMAAAVREHIVASKPRMMTAKELNAWLVSGLSETVEAARTGEGKPC